jgi:hypothetical protein
MLRNRGNLIKTIHLRYSDRSSTTISQPGHLNMTTHMTVLSPEDTGTTGYNIPSKGEALVGARLHLWGLDGTGTIDMTCLRSQEEIQQQEQTDI